MSEQNLTSGTVSYGRPEQAPRPYTGEVAMAPIPINENIIRTIMIRQLNHGYIVEVGCQTFAIESANTLIAKLSEYILNPLTTEAKHKEGKLF
jgi:hypothetical protein